MKHCGTQTITTERLILRRFKESDAEPMFNNWAKDPDVTKYMTWQTHGDISVTKAIIKEWVASYERLDSYNWAIVLKDINEPIGSLGAPSFDETKSIITIGYCISKKYWHKGITSEALKAALKYLFDNTDCNRIQATHNIHNPHSGGVMKKCGMQYEGTLRQYGKDNQGLSDICIYSILRSDIE